MPNFQVAYSQISVCIWQHMQLFAYNKPTEISLTNNVLKMHHSLMDFINCSKNTENKRYQCRGNQSKLHKYTPTRAIINTVSTVNNITKVHTACVNQCLPESPVLGCSPSRYNFCDEDRGIIPDVRIISATCDTEPQTWVTLNRILIGSTTMLLLRYYNIQTVKENDANILSFFACYHSWTFLTLIFQFRLKLVLMSVPAFACMSIVSLKQILSSRQNQVTGE